MGVYEGSSPYSPYSPRIAFHRLGLKQEAFSLKQAPMTLKQAPFTLLRQWQAQPISPPPPIQAQLLSGALPPLKSSPSKCPFRVKVGLHVDPRGHTKGAVSFRRLNVTSPFTVCGDPNTNPNH